jgi:hypothetical protein
MLIFHTESSDEHPMKRPYVFVVLHGAMADNMVFDYGFLILYC